MPPLLFLQSRPNGRIVCAEGGGGRELIANRDLILEWETFVYADGSVQNPQRVCIGDWIGIQAHNGQWVGVGAGERLVADRPSPSTASEVFIIESFQNRHPNGTVIDHGLGVGDVALRAAVNWKFVYATNWGAEPLQASGQWHGPWEHFTLGFAGGNRPRPAYDAWASFPPYQ